MENGDNSLVNFESLVEVEVVQWKWKWSSGAGLHSVGVSYNELTGSPFSNAEIVYYMSKDCKEAGQAVLTILSMVHL